MARIFDNIELKFEEGLNKVASFFNKEEKEENPALKGEPDGEETGRITGGNKTQTEANNPENKGEIRARVEGLKEKVEKKLVYTAAESFEKLDDLLKMAIKSGALNAAIKAEELKGKLVNLYKPESSVNVNNKVVMPAVKVNGVSLNLKIGEGTLDD